MCVCTRITHVVGTKICSHSDVIETDLSFEDKKLVHTWKTIKFYGYGLLILLNHDMWITLLVMGCAAEVKVGLETLL